MHVKQSLWDKAVKQQWTASVIFTQSVTFASCLCCVWNVFCDRLFSERRLVNKEPGWAFDNANTKNHERIWNETKSKLNVKYHRSSWVLLHTATKAYFTHALQKTSRESEAFPDLSAHTYSRKQSSRTPVKTSVSGRWNDLQKTKC